MRKLLISAATLALLVAPALAQGGHGHRDAFTGQQQPAQARQAAPAAAPTAQAAQRDRGDRGSRGGNRGAQTAQPTPQAAPAQTRSGNRDGRSTNRDAGRDAGRTNRGNDNRSGYGNRSGNSNFGRNQRNNYSNFRDYHRGFNAQRRFRAPTYRRPNGWFDRRWTFGEILPSLFWGQQYWLNNYMSYDLPLPPPGTVWVRYGSDALLIDRYSGEIITVQYRVFY